MVNFLLFLPFYFLELLINSLSLISSYVFFLQNIKILLCPQPCSSNRSFSSSQLSLLQELYAFFNFLLSLFSSNCCHLASVSLTPIKSFSTVISFFAKFSGQFCVLLFLSLYHVTLWLTSFFWKACFGYIILSL